MKLAYVETMRFLEQLTVRFKQNGAGIDVISNLLLLSLPLVYYVHNYAYSFLNSHLFQHRRCCPLQNANVGVETRRLIGGGCASGVSSRG